MSSARHVKAAGYQREGAALSAGSGGLSAIPRYPLAALLGPGALQGVGSDGCCNSQKRPFLSTKIRLRCGRAPETEHWGSLLRRLHRGPRGSQDSAQCQRSYGPARGICERASSIACAGAPEGALPRGWERWQRRGTGAQGCGLKAPQRLLRWKGCYKISEMGPGSEGWVQKRRWKEALPFRWREIFTGAFNIGRAGDRQCL